MAILIGNAHPVLNKMKGMQNYMAQFHATFFDGLYYLKTPSPAQKAAWKTSPLAYGVYVENNIPFFLLEFPKEKWSFLTPLNAFSAAANDRQTWINGSDTVLNLFLLNADTNITENIRTLKTDAAIAKKIRETCKIQLTQFASQTAVETAISQIVQTKNFLVMKQTATMVSVMTV